LKKNIGTQDRLIRLGIAIALLVFAYWQRSWIALLAALFVFYEAFSSWCILYHFLEKSSCPTEKK